jgi:hypothetical protein
VARGSLPIGNLNQDVGVIEHLVARAAQEAGRAQSQWRHIALEQGFERSPLAEYGLEFDDHFDGH